MFMLGFVLLLASVCVGKSGSFFLKQPRDTLAVKGDTVILSCKLNVTACSNTTENQGYLTHWQYFCPRQPVGLYKSISTCDTINADTKKYSVSPTRFRWPLSIQNVQSSDDGDYKCSVYSYRNQSHYVSRSARLTVILPIKTAVKPLQITATMGESASFHCQAYRQHSHPVWHNWYFNGTSKDELGIPSSRFKLTGNGRNITISGLDQKFNNTQITCSVLSRKVELTKGGKQALLLVQPRSELPETIGTEETMVVEQVHPNPTGPQPEFQGTAELPKKPFTTKKFNINPPARPTVLQASAENKDTDEDSKPRNEQSDGIPALLLGGIFAAVVLLLVIVFLLYFLLFKSRGKPDTDPNRQSPGTPHSETGTKSNDTAESRLGIGDVSPACSQAISPGTVSVELPTPPTVTGAENSNQQSIAEQDQGEVGKTSVKDAVQLTFDLIAAEAEKSHEIEKSPEALYALPIKKQSLNTKALDALHDSSQGVSGQNTEKTNESKRESPDGSSQSLEDKIQNRPKAKKPIISVKPYSGTGRIASDRQFSDVKPPWAVSYHLSKGRARASSVDTPKPPGDVEDGAKNNDPRQRNVENLVYADLDLRGIAGKEAVGPSIIRTEEETLYADIVNKDILNKLR